MPWLELTMVLSLSNLFALAYLVLKVSYTNGLGLRHDSRMGWWRESTDTYLIKPGLLDFKLDFLNVFGESASLQLLTLLTNHLWLICIGKVPLKCCMVMYPPEGYDKAKPGHVCKLERSSYGLKQASRQCNMELTKFLLQQGFSQSKSDYSLFTKVFKGRFTFILVYVDDLLITGDDDQSIAHVKAKLHEAFTIKDLGMLATSLELK